MKTYKFINNNLLSIFVFTFILFLTQGCSETVIDVKWENYSPIVKERIDKAVATKDCNGLQKEFNAADKHNDNQRRRTGESNAELMAYIDKKMQEANCYAKK